MYDVQATSAADAFHEIMWKMRVVGKTEESRNGPVVVVPGPFHFNLINPTRRVLMCPIRNANPFFHLMETVWILAGDDNIRWLSQFNKRIVEYANGDVMKGAYGRRLFYRWGSQIDRTVHLLRKSPNTRQAVITIWDPTADWMEGVNDRPCNIALCFRVENGALNMTVFNRSNDLVWGMLGANVVHFTYIQEMMATATGIPLGEYHVVSNNLHFYTDLYPNGAEMWANMTRGPDPYPCTTVPILEPDEDFRMLHHQCQLFIAGEYTHETLHSSWLKSVAVPAFRAYKAKEKEERIDYAETIVADDWRRACCAWIERNHSRKEGSDSRRGWYDSGQQASGEVPVAEGDS